MLTIDGHCEPRFTAVREAFFHNFREHGDVGASVCVYLDGERVVDCWGGHADPARARPWTADTVVSVASTTKGMVALCAHMLAERGKLDLDAPVARYWPEFGQAGKADIPVRWLLSHRAGLPASAGRSRGGPARLGPMTEALARASRGGRRAAATATTRSPTATWWARSSAGWTAAASGASFARR